MLPMGRSNVGILVKEWRSRRRISQLDLATKIGVSTRHLSFVETGRSKPSPELVVALGIGLDVPLREQNSMLLAAGYAPRYSQTGLEGAHAAAVRSAIERMLHAHDPYPGLVVDRLWNVLTHNESAGLLIADVPPHLLGPPINVYRLSLHPDGLARHTINLAEWGAHMLGQLRRDLAVTGDPRLAELLDEVSSYPTLEGLDARPPAETPELLIPLHVDIGGRELSFFTTLTTFGTPQDVTLDELVIELFYPADEATARLLSR